MATQAKAFDLADLESSDTAVVNLTHPSTGDEIEGATIEVYSPDSEHARAADSKLRARIQEFARRNQGAKPEQRQKVFDGFERDRNIACIKAISGIAYKGQTITDPREACDKFPWIYRQAVNALNNEANFFNA